MKIGEFSSKTGISIDTLRYYNKIGLIIPDRKDNIRCYTEVDLDKAFAIIKLKNLNFSLNEIKALFDLDKDINDTDKLSKESIERVSSCLNIIEMKYEQILKKEQDIIQTKDILENMINKTKKLIEIGYIPKKGQKI